MRNPPSPENLERSSPLVFNLPRHSHVTRLLIFLRWPLITSCIRFKTLVLTFRVLNRTASSLSSSLTPPPATYSLLLTTTWWSHCSRLLGPNTRSSPVYPPSGGINSPPPSKTLTVSPPSKKVSRHLFLIPLMKVICSTQKNTLISSGDKAKSFSLKKLVK